MRSGVHWAEFELLSMDAHDSGHGIRVGVTRHGHQMGLLGTAHLSADAPSCTVSRAPELTGTTPGTVPSASGGTDEYLRYLQWSRARRAEASVFSREHTWAFEARTGSLVSRGRRTWWREEGIPVPGIDVARESDTVLLRLDLGATGWEKASLAVWKNGVRVGQIVHGLKPGEWCWAVEVWGDGDTVKAKWAPSPPPDSSAVPASLMTP